MTTADRIQLAIALATGIPFLVAAYRFGVNRIEDRTRQIDLQVKIKKMVEAFMPDGKPCMADRMEALEKGQAKLIDSDVTKIERLTALEDLTEKQNVVLAKILEASSVSAQFEDRQRIILDKKEHDDRSHNHG